MLNFSALLFQFQLTGPNLHDSLRDERRCEVIPLHAALNRCRGDVHEVAHFLAGATCDAEEGSYAFFKPVDESRYLIKGMLVSNVFFL